MSMEAAEVKVIFSDIGGVFLSNGWEHQSREKLEGRELNDYRIKKFNLHECFDAFVSSCEVGMRKPDPGIFKLAMGVAQVSPEECVYFDDRPMLVQAAQKQGIKSFHHQDFETTKKILTDLKIKNYR